MSRIEELLRAAYQEAADTVRPEAVRPGVPSTASLRPRRRFTGFAPLAAAAAVVVAIAAAIAVPRLLTAGRATPSPVTSSPGTPPFLVQLPYVGTAPAKLVVQTAGTRHVTAMVTPPAGSTWRAVAATSDHARFVAAAVTTKDCVTRLYDLTLTASGKPGRLVAFGTRIAGQLTSNSALAADRDGSEVAYGTTQCFSQGTGMPHESIGLMTAHGISRQWTLPPAMFLGNLSLTADGGTLVYADRAEPQPWTVRMLPTRSKSGSAHALGRIILAGHGRTSPGSAAISPDGTIIYITTQTGTAPVMVTLAEYHPDGTLLRSLHTWSGASPGFVPMVTYGGNKLLAWGIYQPGTFEVDPVTGKTTSFWIYTPDGEFPESLAW